MTFIALSLDQPIARASETVDGFWAAAWAPDS
jgi:hypothetical protein